MDIVTLRSRLLKLLQKSRKASRLYSSIESAQPDSINPKDLQAKEWKNVTSLLLQELSATLENPNHKKLLSNALSVRDRFYSDYRLCESELNRSHLELVQIAESGDFAKAYTVSKSLIVLKARTQALHAAYNELAEILSKVKNTTDESSFNKLTPQKPEVSENYVINSNVIPLRQKRIVSAF